MRYQRIAFVGKAGVGKTTAADYLFSYWGYVRLSFAAKIREIAQDLWPDDFLNGNKPRRKLQLLGTEVGRAIDKDVWINVVLRRIMEHSSASYVIDDLRFLNEAEVLRNEGFTVVRIIGPQRRSITEEERRHGSETEQGKIFADYEIDNSDTIEEFYALLKRTLIRD